MDNKKTRYVVTMEMYVYAKDDYMARMEAHKLEDKINRASMNADAKISEIGVQPFASMHYKQLDNITRPSKLDGDDDGELPF